MATPISSLDEEPSRWTTPVRLLEVDIHDLGGQMRRRWGPVRARVNGRGDKSVKEALRIVDQEGLRRLELVAAARPAMRLILDRRQGITWVGPRQEDADAFAHEVQRLVQRQRRPADRLVSPLWGLALLAGIAWAAELAPGSRLIPTVVGLTVAAICVTVPRFAVRVQVDTSGRALRGRGDALSILAAVVSGPGAALLAHLLQR